MDIRHTEHGRIVQPDIQKRPLRIAALRENGVSFIAGYADLGGKRIRCDLLVFPLAHIAERNVPVSTPRRCNICHVPDRRISPDEHADKQRNA